MTPEQIIKLAANGNQPAEDFARAWYHQCRVLDDCYDRDKLVTDDRMASVAVQFITEQAGNAWYMEHRAMLYGLMVMSFNAWVDSNQRTGIERAVLAGMYHEVVYCVAFLCGGWSHLRHVTSECREYKGTEGRGQRTEARGQKEATE